MRQFRLTAFISSLFFIAMLTTTTHGQVPKAAGAAALSLQANQTLQNLQMAYFAERNASALYVQYASKADAEGYGQLASMFRAIARGEEIHAGNCAALIREMGETPEAPDEPLIVLSTAENLAAADATQSYENDEMYPQFIKQAREDKNDPAAQVFSKNMAAEPLHHALFQQALKDLNGYKGKNVDFYICPNCGYVVRTLNAPACAICPTANAQFEHVR